MKKGPRKNPRQKKENAQTTVLQGRVEKPDSHLIRTFKSVRALPSTATNAIFSLPGMAGVGVTAYQAVQGLFYPGVAASSSAMGATLVGAGAFGLAAAGGLYLGCRALGAVWEKSGIPQAWAESGRAEEADNGSEKIEETPPQAEGKGKKRSLKEMSEESDSELEPKAKRKATETIVPNVNVTINFDGKKKRAAQTIVTTTEARSRKRRVSHKK